MEFGQGIRLERVGKAFSASIIAIRNWKSAENGLFLYALGEILRIQ